ncbi:MAG: hypothetical protein LUQ07_06900 [Methanospirillum sp.]|nr:hypothetical protein [Methanospirillum sp.]
MNIYLPLVLLITGCIFLAGCIQTPHTPSSESIADIPNNTSPDLQATATRDQVTPANLSEKPEQNITPAVTVMETRSPIATPTPDKNIRFRSQVIQNLTALQEGKEQVLNNWKSANTTELDQSVANLRHLIRNNNDAGSFPKKMDYVRLNYYDYIDRLTQFADNFALASERRNKGDNGSAYSYEKAGEMSGERADISEKRIITFLDDHPVLL